MKKGTGAVAGVDGETCPRCGSVISYEYLRAGGDIPCQGRWLRCLVCNDWIGLLEDDIGDLHLTLVLKRARGGTMDRESLDNVGHVIDIVDHTLEYQHMPTVPVQVRYAQLVGGAAESTKRTHPHHRRGQPGCRESPVVLPCQL